ncbi:MAG: hypothetical protein ACFFDF_07790 [Candidatus Odinarchaeota archaeon]
MKAFEILLTETRSRRNAVLLGACLDILFGILDVYASIEMSKMNISTFVYRFWFGMSNIIIGVIGVGTGILYHTAYRGLSVTFENFKYDITRLQNNLFAVARWIELSMWAAEIIIMVVQTYLICYQTMIDGEHWLFIDPIAGCIYEIIKSVAIFSVMLIINQYVKSVFASTGYGMVIVVLWTLIELFIFGMMYVVPTQFNGNIDIDDNNTYIDISDTLLKKQCGLRVGDNITLHTKVKNEGDVDGWLRSRIRAGGDWGDYKGQWDDPDKYIPDEEENLEISTLLSSDTSSSLKIEFHTEMDLDINGRENIYNDTTIIHLNIPIMNPNITSFCEDLEVYERPDEYPKLIEEYKSLFEKYQYKNANETLSKLKNRIPYDFLEDDINEVPDDWNIYEYDEGTFTELIRPDGDVTTEWSHPSSGSHYSEICGEAYYDYDYYGNDKIMAESTDSYNFEEFDLSGGLSETVTCTRFQLYIYGYTCGTVPSSEAKFNLAGSNPNTWSSEKTITFTTIPNWVVLDWSSLDSSTDLTDIHISIQAGDIEYSELFIVQNIYAAVSYEMTDTSQQKLISEKESHNNVMKIETFGQSAQNEFRTLFEDPHQSGSIEFWLWKDNVSNVITDGFFSINSQGHMYSTDGDFICITQIHQWNHYKITYSQYSCDIYYNGIQVANDVGDGIPNYFTFNITVKNNYLWNDENKYGFSTVYVDAIDFNWEPEYYDGRSFNWDYSLTDISYYQNIWNEGLVINTNIDSDLTENIVKMNTDTYIAEFNFTLILDGDDKSTTCNFTFYNIPYGFSITQDEFSQPLDSNIVFNISADNEFEFAGIYYFDLNLTTVTNDTVFYQLHIPFIIPVVENLQLEKSNYIIFEHTEIHNGDTGDLGYTTNVSKGDLINIDFKCNSTDEVVMIFKNNNIEIREYTLLRRGGETREGYTYSQIIIKDDFSFDQIIFSEPSDYNYLNITRISIIDATANINQEFNLVNFTNYGNVPEFVSFSFSGIPFENINTTLNPDEYYENERIICILPKSTKTVDFNIELPTESISNLYWRGIFYKKTGTNIYYDNYIDNLEIDGIHIISPENGSYYINGDTITHKYNEFKLDIISEEDLVWMGYSFNGEEIETFTDYQTNVTIPDAGIYTLQVFGNNSIGTMFESEMKNFTLNFPSIGYFVDTSNIAYGSTYGFDLENSEGDSGTEIEWIDYCTTYTDTDAKISHIENIHSNILNITDYSSSQSMQTYDDFGNHYSGTVEFWIKQTTITNGYVRIILAQGATDAVHLRFSNSGLIYYTGTDHSICTVPIDEWYHIRIDFECGTGDYEGLGADKFFVYVNGIKYGEYPFWTAVTQISRMYIWMLADYGEIDIDSIGYSWDSDYEVSDNLEMYVPVEWSCIHDLTNVCYLLDNETVVDITSGEGLIKVNGGDHEIQFFGSNSYGWNYESFLFNIFNPMQYVVPIETDNFTFTYGSFETPYGDFRNIDGNYSTINAGTFTPDYYYASTYSFEDVEPGEDHPDWSVYGNTQVIDSLGDHYRVYELYDSSTGGVSELQNIFTTQSYGSIEFWIRTTDSAKESRIRIKENLYHEAFCVRIDEDKFQYFYSGYWYDITSASDNTWYHIRIDFETTAGSYWGLSQWKWHIYVNNQHYGDYSFNGNYQIGRFFVSTYLDENYYTYIDSVSYSWDSNYEALGDNSYWKHYKDVTSDFESEDDQTLGTSVDFIDVYSCTGSCSATIRSFLFDDHEKFLQLYHSSSSGIGDVRNYFSSSQTSGTVEFWFRTTDATRTNYILFFQNTVQKVTARINAEQFQWHDGSWHNLMSISDNTWYHLRIDFECGNGEYQGLSSDTATIYINDVDKGTYSFSGVADYFDTLRFKVDTPSCYYSLLIDAVGYSWDQNYDIGDNEDIIYDEISMCDIDTQTDVKINDLVLGEDVILKYSLKTNISITIDLDIWNWETSEWFQVNSIYNSVSFDAYYFVLSDCYMNDDNDVKIRFQSVSISNPFNLQIDQLRIDYIIA